MKHDIHYIKSFQIIGLHTIKICFENNTCKTINFSPVLYGEMYGPLKDTEFFKRVKLDDEVHTLVWPNGADFDPSLLYHWEQYVEELSFRAKQWRA